jgi:hypothetical protein
MDNPEILATLCTQTQDEDKQNKKQKTKKMSYNAKGKPASCKTPAVFSISKVLTVIEERKPEAARSL